MTFICNRRLASTRVAGQKIAMKHAIAVVALSLTLTFGAGATSQSAEAPFDASLSRLAEILGSLHFLRNLCGEESQEWRDQMIAILESENSAGQRRGRLVGRFNHGYSALETNYERCTDSAVEAIERYMHEGADLAGETATRFGN